jgi:hypothetical protein
MVLEEFMGVQSLKISAVVMPGDSLTRTAGLHD